jgi:peroxin-16
MLLLRLTHRPLVTPAIPERDFDPSQLVSSNQAPLTAPSTGDLASTTPDHIHNNRIPLTPHPILASNSEATAEDYLLPKALSPSSVRPATSLVRRLSGPRDWLAEAIYILRPLVYGTSLCLQVWILSIIICIAASLLVADRTKGRTNRALTVALSMELLSRCLRRTPPVSATLERSEYARRDKDMLWYLLRGSIWETYTRLALNS